MNRTTLILPARLRRQLARTTLPLRRKRQVGDSPLVTEERIRGYAGFAPVSSRGRPLGTLCVLGTQRRSFTAGELEVLRDLTARAVERLEQR